MLLGWRNVGDLEPPCVVLVIRAVPAEQNIAKLFVAAFIPGILATVGYVIAIAIYVSLKPGITGEREPASYAERVKALLNSLVGHVGINRCIWWHLCWSVHPNRGRWYRTN